MSNKKKRKCIVCGKEYEYCNSCKTHIKLPTWMSLYHNDNCRNIMNIATEYMAGNITQESAKSKLDACDLREKARFKESVLNAINEIYVTKKADKAYYNKESKKA